MRQVMMQHKITIPRKMPRTLVSCGRNNEYVLDAERGDLGSLRREVANLNDDCIDWRVELYAFPSGHLYSTHGDKVIRTILQSTVSTLIFSLSVFSEEGINTIANLCRKQRSIEQLFLGVRPRTHVCVHQPSASMVRSRRARLFFPPASPWRAESANAVRRSPRECPNGHSRPGRAELLAQRVRRGVDAAIFRERFRRQAHSRAGTVRTRAGILPQKPVETKRQMEERNPWRRNIHSRGAGYAGRSAPTHR